MDLQLSWLERTIHIRKVTGSSPVRSTKMKKSCKGIFCCKKENTPYNQEVFSFFLTLITVIVQRKPEALVQD